MALFNPEGLVRSLVSAMGLTPEQIQAFINELVAELRDMRADRLAFKPASARAYQDVVQRLDRIDAALDRVDAKINLMLMHHESDQLRAKLHLNPTDDNDEPEYRNGSATGVGKPGGG